jgi:hypothetical protein
MPIASRLAISSFIGTPQKVIASAVYKPGDRMVHDRAIADPDLEKELKC